MSDSDRPFSPSPSPDEEFGGDSDQDWEVSGIVGESIDAFDVKRYEIKWGAGWTRTDGTNTTWESRPTEELAELVTQWEEKQHAKRTAAAAKDGPQIKIGFEDWQMLHEDRTVERARGYEELKARYLPEGNPRMRVDLDSLVIPLRPRASDAPPAPALGETGNRRGDAHSEREQGPGTTGPSTLGSNGSSRVQGSSRRSRARIWSNSPSPVREARPVRPLPRRRAVIPPSPVSSVPDEDDAREQHHVVRMATTENRHRSGPLDLHRRRALQMEWAERLYGAAPVVFVNEVNNEETPDLAPGFQYLERGYVLDEGVFPIGQECLVSCDCERRCLYADDCECQRPSELVDGEGQKILAYNRDRLFNFKLSPGMEIIECNELCTCSEECMNRVAQRPRDVPIEVFRTTICGWGARATVPLPRGKVVGIYTGLLLRRHVADSYEAQGKPKSYIFDLDVREDDEDDGNIERYSVDGYAHGNWTRHSCEPNMRVVPVVWDTIPELNRPYLAFVTTQEIPVRTELTIDYDPKAAMEARNKGRSRERTPEGARQCACGTESCRGWVRV